jgi:hypothetical protein
MNEGEHQQTNKKICTTEECSTVPTTGIIFI